MGIALGLVLAVCVVMAAPRGGAGAGICLSGRLNPNTAPVSSLVRLPGIGLARASAIVAHRTRVHAETGRQAVFRHPDDLQQIRGIGPKTAGEIASWLDFDVFRQAESQETLPPAPIRTRQ